MPTDVNSLGILLQISANSIVLSGSACLFNKGPKGRSRIVCKVFIYSSHGLKRSKEREKTWTPLRSFTYVLALLVGEQLNIFFHVIWLVTHSCNLYESIFYGKEDKNRPSSSLKGVCLQQVNTIYFKTSPRKVFQTNIHKKKTEYRLHLSWPVP